MRMLQKKNCATVAFEMGRPSFDFRVDPYSYNAEHRDAEQFVRHGTIKAYSMLGFDYLLFRSKGYRRFSLEYTERLNKSDFEAFWRATSFAVESELLDIIVVAAPSKRRQLEL